MLPIELLLFLSMIKRNCFVSSMVQWWIKSCRTRSFTPPLIVCSTVSIICLTTTFILDNHIMFCLTTRVCLQAKNFISRMRRWPSISAKRSTHRGARGPERRPCHKRTTRNNCWYAVRCVGAGRALTFCFVQDQIQLKEAFVKRLKESPFPRQTVCVLLNVQCALSLRCFVLLGD